MLLGVILMICFEILSNFGENRKKEKLEKIWHFGFLRRSVGNPRHGVALHRSVGCPRRDEAMVPKGHPSGTLRRSLATLWRRYYSCRNKFWIFVPKV